MSSMNGYAQPERARRHRLGRRARRRPRRPPGRGRRRYHRLRDGPHRRRGRLELADTICSSGRCATSRPRPSGRRCSSRSGIGNDTTVVLYGDNHNWFAAFAYWLFKLYGHEDVRLMNGGRAKWLAEGRETTTDVPAITPTTYTRRRSRTAPARLPRRGRRPPSAATDAALVDVRSPKEYSGELLAPENLPQEGAQRGGHVPGAAQHPLGHRRRRGRHLQAAPTSCAPSTAARASRRTRPPSPTAGSASAAPTPGSCCTELLGYPNVRNYDGSWTEWGSLIGAPIER